MEVYIVKVRFIHRLFYRNQHLISHIYVSFVSFVKNPSNLVSFFNFLLCGFLIKKPTFIIYPFVKKKKKKKNYSKNTLRAINHVKFILVFIDDSYD